MAPVVAWAAGGLGILEGTIGYALLEIGGSMLLSAAASALMPKPDTGLKGRTLTVRQPVAPRHMVYGRVRKGGTVIFMDNSRVNGGRLDLIVALAGHQVEVIGNIYFDGKLAFVAGSVTPEPWLQNHAAIERLNGLPSQMGSSYLATVSPGLWTAQHRLQGVAALYVTLSFNADIFPTGIPNITVDIWGKSDILDPRTGNRGYTENAALCLADYLAHPFYGLNAGVGAADGTNQAQLIAAANICDEVVAKAAGGTERRYTLNGVVILDQSPKTIIEAMLSAMGGDAVWQAGQWYIYPAAYIPPALTFSDDDVAGAGLVLQTRVSRADNFNGVRGQFVSPENDWQPDDFPAYASAAYLAEDGGERIWSDITLPFTISSSAAQRLAKITLERQRRQMAMQMTGKLSTWRATVGDVVNFDYARWGFAAKPFQVRRMTLGLQGDGEGRFLAPEFTLRETSPLVYDWSASEEQIYAAAPRTTLPSALDVAPPGGVSVTESLYQTTDGTGVKVKITLDWVASTSAFVVQYQAEGRIGSGPWQVLGRTDQVTLDVPDFQRGQWEFQIKAISQAGVSSAYTTPLAREIFGLAAPPAALTGVTLQVAGGMAILKWAQHPDLDVLIGGAIVIRHSASASPDWAVSVGMDIVAGAQAIAVVPQKPGSYLIRAEDASGIQGPVTIIDASGAQVLDFAPVMTLTEDAGFVGTKTGCFATGGELRLSAGGLIDTWADFDAVADLDSEGGILPLGTYQFGAGMDLGAIRRVRLRSEIELYIVAASDLVDGRVGNIDDWLSFDGADGGEVDVRVEVRLTDDDPAGSPVWGGWSRVDSTEVSAWGVEARAVLTTTDATFTPSVTLLRLVADEVL